MINKIHDCFIKAYFKKNQSNFLILYLNKNLSETQQT